MYGEPHHRNHVSDDQNDVLRHLGPGHRLHAAEERAHQNAGETDEYADLELQASETAGDKSDAIDLRDHIGEGADDRGKHADHARAVATETGAEKVGNGE